MGVKNFVLALKCHVCLLICYYVLSMFPWLSFCRKDLKLSRDFESLMTKNEKSCASEAGHDANALEDLPAQQFSLESWIGATTPGTSRTIGLDGCFLFFDERPGCLAASREQKLEVCCQTVSKNWSCGLRTSSSTIMMTLQKSEPR